MTEPELLERRKTAFKVFRTLHKNIPEELADDFASYCVEKWLSGKRLETSIYRLSVDFIRTLWRYNGKGSIDALSSETVPIEETQEPHHISDDIQRFIAHDYLKSLDPIQRQGLILLEYGFTLEEIGAVFCEPGEAVSQHIRGAVG